MLGVRNFLRRIENQHEDAVLIRIRRASHHQVIENPALLVQQLRVALPAGEAEGFARKLIAEPEVSPIGLGARDSLRLEAGLCLYGHDIDASTSPVEAGLAWSIGKRRREERNFPGASRIVHELEHGASRRRVGIELEGRIPAREGAEILSEGGVIGRVTSGGFGPSVDHPIAMGYVDAAHSNEGTALSLIVRDVPRPAHVAPLPFVPTRYYRG